MSNLEIDNRQYRPRDTRLCVLSPRNRTTSRGRLHLSEERMNNIRVFHIPSIGRWLVIDRNTNTPTVSTSRECAIGKAMYKRIVGKGK